LEISIEPWKKLVIHEVIEYTFEDWMTQIAFSSKTAGGAIPTINWANGIVLWRETTGIAECSSTIGIILAG